MKNILLTMLLSSLYLLIYGQDPALQGANFDVQPIATVGQTATLTIDGSNAGVGATGTFGAIDGTQPLEGFKINVDLPATGVYVLNPASPAAVTVTVGDPADWNITIVNDASTNFTERVCLEMVGIIEAFEAFQFEIDVIGAIDNNGANQITQVNIDLGNDPITAGTDVPTNNFEQSATGVLPVELTFFRGKSTDCNINLFWQTASEQNFNHFEVERSLDGKQFESIAKVAGAGNSLELLNYSLEDKDSDFGTNYYRLKAVDLDETYEYSEVITVQNICKDGEEGIQVFPNPVGATQKLNILLYSNESDLYFTITSSKGDDVLFQKNASLERGWSTLDIDVSSLPAGSYLLKTNDGQVAQFLKINE